MTKKTIVAAGGIVCNERDELLLIFRRGVWDLPKGKLDEGETIEQCAVREVEEETGVQNVELGKFIYTTRHEYFDKWIKSEVIKETHWYAMRIFGNQTLVPQKEEEIDEILWVPANDVKNYMNNMHKNIIEVIGKYLNASIA
jgi:8-oxo-dGTP pyrophosphatase MutT (NUDIX family)